MDKKKVYVYSHTHWDRTWYASFEEFRYRLVLVLDEVMELLETDPEFRCFVFDGQTCILEDYCEIKPEAKDRLLRLVSEGKFEVGPWYVLPDVFIPSGESLVRNFIVGRKVGEQFGGVLNAGYIPDSFGFPCQLPAILKGSGIDTFLFMRGSINDAMLEAGTEFMWKSEGPQNVLAIRLVTGYGGGGKLGHQGNEPLNVDSAFECLQKMLQTHEKQSNSGVFFIPNGGDHQRVQRTIPTVIREANKRFRKYHFVHAGMNEMVQNVKCQVDNVQEFAGEIQSPNLRGVQSTRMYLKQMNHDCQQLLEHYAEPLATFNYLLGDKKDNNPFLEHAWKLLIKTHPHDDICGCSVDSVHRDMEHTYEVISRLANSIERNSFMTFAQNIDVSGQKGIPLVFFNSLSHSRNEIATITVPFRYETEDIIAKSFSIIDSEGAEVPYVIEKEMEHIDVPWWPAKGYNRNIVTIALPVNIPSFGYATYYVKKKKAKVGDVPFVVEENAIENNFYRMQFHANGSFDLKVKKTGKWYRNLHVFEDSEDAGDEYDYASAENGHTITSKDCAAAVTIDANQIKAQVTIQYALDIPESLEETKESYNDATKVPKKRSERLIPHTFETTITVYEKSPRIDMVTKGENLAKDHRLRILFPVAMHTSTHSVEEHFSVIQRMHRQSRYPTYNQKRFVTFKEGKNVYTIYNKGLPEYEVKDGSVFALTLVRSVGWLARTNAGPKIKTPEAQCIRSFVWEYGICAHGEDELKSFHEAANFNVPLTMERGDEEFETETEYRFLPVPRTGTLPPVTSLIKIDSVEVIVSAFKKAERYDAAVLRVYSIGKKKITTTVSTHFAINRVLEVDMHENVIEPAGDMDEHSFSFPIEKGEIKTFMLFKKI